MLLANKFKCPHGGPPASTSAAKSLLAHVDGQTKSILSDVVPTDPIVDSDSDVAAGSPLHLAHLGAGYGWVRTYILSVCNPEDHVVGVGPDALDGLDRVRDDGVVDERAVPDGSAMSMRGPRLQRA